MLSCHAALADAPTKGFDVQLMFEPMQHVVADRAVVAHADQRHPLGGERLMSQPPEGLRRLGRTFGVHGAIVRESLASSGVMVAQAVHMLGGGPRLFRQFFQSRQRPRGSTLTR